MECTVKIHEVMAKIICWQVRRKQLGWKWFGTAARLTIDLFTVYDAILTVGGVGGGQTGLN